MTLNAHIHDFLLTLERERENTKDQWVHSSHVKHVPHHARVQAVRAGYVEARGNTAQRQYKLLAAGLTALGMNAQDNIDRWAAIENGHVPAESAIVVSPPAPPKRQKKTSAKDDGGLYKDALDIVRLAVPDAAPLIAKLEQMIERKGAHDD